MPLPASWIEEIFSRLTLRYGTAFQRQYADLDPVAVRADWADVLGFLESHPKAIRYALDNLHADRPPNAGQFRAIAMPALSDTRQPAAPALPAPVADPARVAAALASIGEAPAKSLAQQCIENIERAADRAMLTPSQRWVLAACKRQAMGDPVESGVAQTATMIPPEALPPAMRYG